MKRVEELTPEQQTVMKIIDEEITKAPILINLHELKSRIAALFGMSYTVPEVKKDDKK